MTICKKWTFLIDTVWKLHYSYIPRIFKFWMCQFLKNWERLFCFPLSRLQRNKWIGLCMVRHPLDAYLRKFILIGKEFVLLCKMIEKQQEISSCRSTNKVCHIFLALVAGIQKSWGREWCWIRKLDYWRVKNDFRRWPNKYH